MILPFETICTNFKLLTKLLPVVFLQISWIIEIRPFSDAWCYVVVLLLFINYASTCSSGHFGVLLPTRAINRCTSVLHEHVHVPVQVQARLLQPQRREPRGLPSVFLLRTFAGLLVVRSPCRRKHHFWLHGRYNPTNASPLNGHLVILSYAVYHHHVQNK